MKGGDEQRMSESKAFEIGDVVRLNSDAVRKTVAEIKAGRVVCNWHDWNDDCLEDDYDPRMLTLVRAREK